MEGWWVGEGGGHWHTLTFPRVSGSCCWSSGTRATPQISVRSARLHHSELGSCCWTCCHQLLQKKIKKKKKNVIQTTDGGLVSSDYTLLKHLQDLCRFACCGARVVVIEPRKHIGSANTLKAQIKARFELDDAGSDPQRREGGVPVEAQGGAG